MSVLQVEAVPARILLLYLLVQFPSLISDLFPRVTEDLVKFFIRRHLTDIPKTRDLDDLFVEIVEEVGTLGLSATSSAICALVHQKLKSRVSDLDSVRGPLLHDIDKSSFARVLLCRIEIAQRSPEDLPDLWAEDANRRPLFTLEHILPQGDLASVLEWRTAISPDNPDDAEQVQSDFCQKLGNLTLTSFNAELSNSPFIEKRDAKQGEQYVGYRNGLRLNTYVEQQNSWGPEQITRRGEEIALILIRTLVFNGETLSINPQSASDEADSAACSPTV
jgi:hypothetical protein